MSIVERLRVIAKAISEEDWRELSMRVPAEPERDADLVVMKAADLIEQQAERIKELEAERDGWREDANISRNSIAMLKDRCNHFEDTLAALRQRIDDAPVVAWMGEYNINDIRDHYTVVMRSKTDFDKLPERLRPLYTTPQPAIPEWQPIETAPKEWGSYLIWHPKYGMETLWFQLKDGGSDGRKAGNWYAEEGEDDYPRNYQVTHWMPLPAAPKPENSHE